MKVPKNEQEVKGLLETAAEALFDNQPDIYSLTPASGDTEMYLVHYYTNEVRRLLPESEYDCDPEINKRLPKKIKRPDLVVHKRGTHDHNFLVIEVKRNGKRGQIKSDGWKIKNYFFKEPYKYDFGALVNLKSDKKYSVEVLENKPEKAIE